MVAIFTPSFSRPQAVCKKPYSTYGKHPVKRLKDVGKTITKSYMQGKRFELL